MANYDLTYEGQEVQDILDAGNKLEADGYIFCGVATPSTNPGTPTEKVYYAAKGAGTYTNFGGAVLANGLHLLIWNGSSWNTQTFFMVDDVPTAGSDNLVKSGGVYEYAVEDNIFLTREYSYKVINNRYINNSGTWVTQSNQGVIYIPVSLNERIRIIDYQGNPYANVCFFASEPISGLTPQSVITGHTEKVLELISPVNGYMATSFPYVYKKDVAIYRCSDENKIVNVSLADKIDKNTYVFSTTPLTPVGEINNYYINNIGIFISQNLQKIKIYPVAVGDILKTSLNLGKNYCNFAYFTEYPTTSSVPTRIVTLKDSMIDISKTDGYVCICEVPLYNAYNDLYKTIGNVSELVGEAATELTGFDVAEEPPITILGYYINRSGAWVSQSGQAVLYWKIANGEKVKISNPNYANSNYVGYALFSSSPKPSVSPTSYALVSSLYSEITSNIDGYIAVSIAITYGQYAELWRASTVALNTEKIGKSIKMYQGKKCLYIGDSISTDNNYHWKGYLQDFYNIFMQNDSGSIRPAEGGITVIPPTTEPASDSSKSIWYRCAQNRMAGFDFDFISLFGGTNDMSNQNLVIGTVDDIAYVDDATGFSASEATDVRPSTLSFASALKGCILMLRRDFPAKEIVLATVMPCGSGYGNWVDTATGLHASEAIAYLQLRIAELYNLKCVPLYWDMRTEANAAYNWADQYGVHPNHQGARRIMALYAQTLGL